MDTTQHFAPISEVDLLRLGLENLAYVKLITEESGPFYAIHAADGTEIGRAPDLDLALAAIRQQGLEGLRVH